MPKNFTILSAVFLLLFITGVKFQENPSSLSLNKNIEPLGRFCHDDDDCDSQRYIICSANRKCACAPNTSAVNATTCGVMLDYKCLKNGICASKYADCIDEKCKCRENYVSSSNSCFAAALGTSCQDHGACGKLKFSVCTKAKVCGCMSNAVKISPEACGSVLGGLCWSNDDCIVDNSYCLYNFCKCWPKFVPRSRSECVPGSLLMDCSDDIQCSYVVKNSECRNGTCVCKANYRSVDVSQCRPLIGVGCSAEELCGVPNSVCIDKKCQCLSHFVHQNEKCERKELHSSCNVTEDCNGIINAICFDNECRCKNGYHQINSHSCGSYLEVDCDSNEECWVTHSICTDGKCQCRPNYRALSATQCIGAFDERTCKNDLDCIDTMYTRCSEELRCQCRPNYGKFNDTACAPLVGRNCWADGLCATENSNCIDQECQCRKGYIRLGDECILDYLGSYCIDNADCRSVRHAFCFQGKCGCRGNNTQINATTCAPLLGEYCWKNDKCAPENSVCIDDECRCIENYRQKFNYQCEPTLLGQSCHHDSDCKKMANSECSVENECQCKPNFIATADKKACKALLNGYCLYDSDCYNFNAICIDNTCQCLPSFRPQSNKNCTLIYTNVSCDRQDQCSVAKNVTCSPYGKCVCDEGHVAIDDYNCVPLLKNGCEKHCGTLNSICIDRKCQCKRGYAPQNGIHCQPTLLGLHCQHDVDCASIPYARCSNHRCECKSKYVRISKVMCGSLLGGFCISDEFCEVENSVCIDGECQCRKDFSPLENTNCIFDADTKFCRDKNDCKEIVNAVCVKNECQCSQNHFATSRRACKVTLGGSCKSDEDCGAKNSVCVENKCQCRHNFVTFSNNQCKLSKLGGKCETNADCASIQNAVCSPDEICVCEENHFLMNDWICTPAIGAFCTPENQCVSEGMLCIDHECQCAPEQAAVSASQCVKRNELYGCVTHDECSDLWHAMCSAELKCVCKENNVQVGNSCLAILDGYCWRDDQCVVENSLCIDFRCQCSGGFVPVANNTCVERH